MRSTKAGPDWITSGGLALVNSVRSDTSIKLAEQLPHRLPGTFERAHHDHWVEGELRNFSTGRDHADHDAHHPIIGSPLPG